MSNARTTIDIDPAPYVRSHMKQPRGYGSWAFASQPNPRDVCKGVVFTPAMTTLATPIAATAIAGVRR